MKHEPWSTKFNALGLLWDTNGETVSIPSDKVERIQGVLEQARNMTRMSQRAIIQIVGSLRHVKRFIPQAAPWLNGIQDLQAASTKGSWSKITTAVRRDLQWWSRLVERQPFWGIPLQRFTREHQTDQVWKLIVRQGSAVVLRLATRQYLTVVWDTTEDSEPNQVNIAACNGANTTACGKRDLGDFAACEVELSGDRYDDCIKCMA